MGKYKRILKVILLALLFVITFWGNSNASSDIIVMLDPGHGGNDPGTVYEGVIEKEVTWKIAQKVKSILDKTPGIKGILTRNQNTNPSLYDRGVSATKNGADLLVSFHINSTSRDNSASGAEVYVTGDINSSRYYNSSNTLGLSILKNLRSIGLKSFDARTKIKLSTDGERYSDGFISDYYGIIRNPMYYGIPGVLIEHCYINHVNDRTNFLSTDQKINLMAEQDANAIIQNKELFRTDKSKNAVNSEIKSINVNTSKTHLTGQIVVVDWLYGMQSVPVSTPIIKLVSTDSKHSINCYVSKENGNTYYFDTWLSNLKSDKKYKIEVSTQNTASIPKNNKMNPNLGNNKKLYSSSKYTYNIKDNLIQIQGKEQSDSKSYKGDVTSEIKELNWIEKSNYFTGKIIAIEWVNGKSTVPKTLPVITVKSADNKYSKKCFVKQISGNTYYFDICIKGIDQSKKYTMEISSENPNNISANKKQTINLKKLKQTIGKYKDTNIKIKDNMIVFEKSKYIGNMNSELKKLTLGVSNKNSYISGEIIIVEWIDGKSTVPTKKPKMRFKSTDGKADLEVFVTATGTNTYYFDRFIEGIDTSKEYKFIVESSDENNVSEYRSVPVYFTGKFKNKTIGKYRDFKINLENHKIIFKKQNVTTNKTDTITNEVKTKAKSKVEVKANTVTENTTNAITNNNLQNNVTKDGDKKEKENKK